MTVLVLATLSGCGRAPRVEGSTTVASISELPPAPELPIQGVALGLYFVEEDRTYVSYMWEAANAGADTISLVTAWSQADVRATDIHRHPELTADDDDLRQAIRDAHNLGLDVMLLPILRLEHRDTGEWRGRLEPADRAAWWVSYRTFVDHYLQIAIDEGVEIYSIGSELGSMQPDEAEWRSLIEDARAGYDGQLTYSANWDRYDRVPFWDALDLMGSTAYFELSEQEGENPDVPALVDAWTPFADDLCRVSNEVQRPLVLTEIGYVSQAGAAWHPWDYTQAGDVDLGAQYDLYHAALLAWREQDCLGGIFFWNWFGDGGTNGNGYSPRGKPAEQLLRYWYGGPLSGIP